MHSIASTELSDIGISRELYAACAMIKMVRESHKFGFNLDDPDDVLQDVATICTVDGALKAGVAFVTHQGEIRCLCGWGGVFDELLSLCILAGGKSLNVFDGALVSRYESHGFSVYRREEYDPSIGSVPQWAGTPDVVYMRRG